MKYAIALILICISAVLVHAQTQSVVDADGNTIVEVVTVDPVAGLATTETLSTITGTTKAAAAAPTTINQGPVAQPAATQTGQTTFQYTTTDAAGETTVVDDTFTPTSITATVTPTLSLTGTVLEYSSWLAMVGTNTVADSNNLASGAIPTLPTRAWVSAATLLVGIVGGAWIVL